MTLLESTTEDFAKALLTASGSSTPLTFERLRDEVEREVGPGATALDEAASLRRDIDATLDSRL
jgi:hypothetical protein